VYDKILLELRVHAATHYWAASVEDLLSVLLQHLVCALSTESIGAALASSIAATYVAAPMAGSFMACVGISLLWCW
jgi:hypothetical protein